MRTYEFTCPKGHLHYTQKRADNCQYCDPKWKEKRTNKPGESVHFKNIKEKHTKELVPVRQNIVGSWFTQMGLFNDQMPEKDDSRHHDAPIKMGLFYELMVSAFFGGKVIDSIKEFDIGRSAKNGEGIIPDVVSMESKQVFESKACKQGSHSLLRDNQIIKYQQFARVKKYEVYYCYWRHGLKGIHSYRESTETLFKSLGQWTFAGIILPFSIILNLWENEHGLCHRYNTTKKGWLECTSVRGNTLNKFILSPEDIINRIGLDPQQYQIERLLSPKGFMVENIDVVQFPIIIIKDHDPKGWVQWYANQIPF